MEQPVLIDSTLTEAEAMMSDWLSLTGDEYAARQFIESVQEQE